MTNKILFRLDWLSLMIFLLLIIFGIINIYSTTLSENPVSLLELDSPVAKQLWIFIFSLFFLPIILYINSNFFQHLSLIFYVISIFSLIGLFFFWSKDFRCYFVVFDRWFWTPTLRISKDYNFTIIS